MANEWLFAGLLAWIGGLGIPIGGYLNISLFPKLKKNRGIFNHFMTAVGGGALLSAVALVLVPEGMGKQNDYVGVATFILGGFIYLLIDKQVSKAKGGGPQVVAMVSDFIPEAIALGAVYLIDPNQAYLLSGIMMIQNIPEGYNAFFEFSKANDSALHKRRTLYLFLSITILGPVCAFLGTSLFAKYDAALGVLMTCSAGGITYLIFRDIAPAAQLKKSYAAPFGAIVGFALGLLGWSLVN